MKAENSMAGLTSHTMSDIFVDVDAVFVMTVRLQTFLNAERTVDAVPLRIRDLSNPLRDKILFDNEIDPERQFFEITHLPFPFLRGRMAALALVCSLLLKKETCKSLSLS